MVLVALEQSMIEKIKTYFWGILAFLFGGLLLVQTIRLELAQTEAERAIKSLDSKISFAQAELAEANIKAREKEQGLNTSASTTRKETNDKIRTLTTQRDNLLKRVLIAESKEASASYLPQSNSASCIGTASERSDRTELLGSIGTKDVEEASRADTIRVELLACYKHYEDAQKALSK